MTKAFNDRENNQITPQAEQRQLIRDIHHNMSEGLLNLSDMAQLMGLLFDHQPLDTIRAQMEFYIEMNIMYDEIGKVNHDYL